MNPGFTERPGISEVQISALVDAFYAKVRRDHEIGPIFNAIVDDWPHHLALLKDFWSSVLLATGRYKGNPMMRHLPLGLDPQHFERWLALFAETAHEIFPPESAALVIDKSHRIAQNLQYMAAIVREQAANI
jgi:hemoglobin